MVLTRLLNLFRNEKPDRRLAFEKSSGLEATYSRRAAKRPGTPSKPSKLKTIFRGGVKTTVGQTTDPGHSANSQIKGAELQARDISELTSKSATDTSSVASGRKAVVALRSLAAEQDFSTDNKRHLSTPTRDDSSGNHPTFGDVVTDAVERPHEAYSEHTGLGSEAVVASPSDLNLDTILSDVPDAQTSLQASPIPEKAPTISLRRSVSSFSVLSSRSRTSAPHEGSRFSSSSRVTAVHRRSGFSINRIVKCQIHTSVDEVELPPISMDVEWLKDGEYERVMRAISRAHAIYSSNKIRTKGRIVRVNCFMALVAPDAELGLVLDRHRLSTEGHWAFWLPIMVAGYCAKNPGTEVRLDIWSESVFMATEPIQDSFLVLRRMLLEKFTRNYAGEQYMPGKWVNVLLEKEIILKLIEEDKSLHGKLSDSGREAFANHIWLWATRMLAICIDTGFRLSILHQLTMPSLYSPQFTDADLPIAALPPEIKVSQRNAEMFLQRQKKYNIFTFEAFENGKIQSFDAFETHYYSMPIQSRRDLGEGSFARVMEVIIDEDYHVMSQVRIIMTITFYGFDGQTLTDTSARNH
jgi:hypothetical protein